LVPKSMTLDDLERTKRHSCKNKQFFMEPNRKMSLKVDQYYQRQNKGL